MQSNVGGRDGIAWLMVVFLAICSLSPNLAWIVMWFFPLPLTIISAKTAFWIPGLLSACAGLCLMHAGLGWSAWMAGLSFFFMAWVMGDALRDNEPPFGPIITGTLVVVMMELVLLSFLRAQGHDLEQEILRTIQTASQGGGTPKSAEWKAFTTDVQTNFRLLLPGMLCVIGFLVSAFNLLGARSIQHYGRHPDEFGIKPFLEDFQLPSSVSALYLVMTACFLLGMFKQPGWPSQAAQNIALVSGFFMGIQGLSLMWRRLKRKRGRFGILILLIAAGCLVRLIGQLYILVGLYDILSYKRRRDV